MKPGQIPRTAAAVFAAAAIVVMAAACSSPSSTGAGGSPDSGGAASAGASASAGGSTSSPSAVAYSQCMRSHGVPRYPDPSNGGQLPKGNAQHFGVSDSVLQAAQQACQHLLPTGGSLQQQAQECFQGGDCPPSLVRQIETAQRKFAECMRSHGVPNWPDPSLDSEGRPVFNLVPVGITHSQTHSPPISTKVVYCGHLDPAPVVMVSN